LLIKPFASLIYIVRSAGILSSSELSSIIY
jgi:hypothetical protein